MAIISSSKEITIGDLRIEKISVEGYEALYKITHPGVGLRAFIAIHNTNLGPALGGTRYYQYSDEQSAITDVLRLAKGMSYKAALAGLKLGGGKSVIMGDPSSTKTPELFQEFGKAVNALNGEYICAVDVGTNGDDLAEIQKMTPYVVGVSHDAAMMGGDPSPFTAWGVYRAIQATLFKLYGNSSVNGRTIAIQGLGAVGGGLAQILFWNGANLCIADTDPKKVKQLSGKLEAKIYAPNEIHSAPCDIFSPCAMGGILNSKSIPELKCRGIAGGANNQLLKEEDGAAVVQRGILYAPDYVTNSAGLIKVANELVPGGYSAIYTRNMVDQIYDTLLSIYALAEKQGTSTELIANALADERIYGSAAEKQEVQFESLTSS